MTYRGVVKNGVVVLGGAIELPEGMEVCVEPVHQVAGPDDGGSSLAEQFRDIIGAVPEWPPDMAERHDRYLHGAFQR